MPRQYKKFGLKHTRRPAKSPLLSTTVSVVRKDGSRFYCYVSFADDLVKAVGKALPWGLTEDRSAMLHAIESEKGWEIRATYVGLVPGVRMWFTTSEPEWLRFYKIRGTKWQSSSEQ